MKKWWKRLTMLHVYKVCKCFYWGLSWYGIYLALWHAGITDGKEPGTEGMAIALFLTGMICMILGVIGVQRFRYLERKYVREQRKEDRRVLRRSA